MKSTGVAVYRKTVNRLLSSNLSIVNCSQYNNPNSTTRWRPISQIARYDQGINQLCVCSEQEQKLLLAQMIALVDVVELSARSSSEHKSVLVSKRR